MEAIRKGASSWIVKIVVLVPLILAFAIWGIEDMLRGGTYGAIATVGEREINADQFRENYNDQINQLARRTGRRLTPQQAARLRIPDQVLSSMLGSLAVEQHAESLNLSLSDDAVLREIVTDPAYQDSNGNFDRDQLRGLLAQVGMSEAAFLSARRQSELRDQITDSMLAGVRPSQTLVDLTNAFRNETRTAKFITVPPPKDDAIAKPNDKDMKEYFEKRKASFKTPELRKATVLEITAESVGKTLKVSDEDLKKQYEASKQSYVTPERRTIEQIVFESEDAAKKAKSEIDGGKDFMEVAKANGVSEADVKIGERAKSDLIDNKIADAAFSLKKDEVSAPVQGSFSTVLLRVTDIKEGETQPFDKVKDQLRETIVAQRLPEEIQSIHDEVDNRKLAGKSTDEIAKELGLELKTIEAVDRRGRDAEGKDILVGADASRAVAQIFEGLVGVESAVIERSDGGYTWVDVLDITPSRDQTFDEVKADIATALIEQRRADALRKTAQGYVDRIKKGETFEAVAKDAGLEITTTPAFKRGDSPQGMPAAAVAQAFTLPVGGASAAAAERDPGRVVFSVADIVPAPKLADEARTQIQSELQGQQRTDMLSQYLASLQSELGVSIDQTQLVRVLGLDQTAQ